MLFVKIIQFFEEKFSKNIVVNDKMYIFASKYDYDHVDEPD
jgi:hypothetical protein